MINSLDTNTVTVSLGRTIARFWEAALNNVERVFNNTGILIWDKFTGASGRLLNISEMFMTRRMSEKLITQKRGTANG